MCPVSGLSEFCISGLFLYSYAYALWFTGGSLGREYCGVHSHMLYVVCRSYIIYITCVVIFVSRAVYHMLAYTAYTHVHTTHMCNPAIEFRLM